MNYLQSDTIEEVFPENEMEENTNNVTKQRAQQKIALIQKVEELLSNSSENLKDSETTKLKEYVFTLYNYFEREWVDFNEDNDQEIGNCYKYCINKLNIFKNILRAFFSYMKNKGDDIVIECLDSFQKPIQKVKKQFIRFSERHPANNKSMTVLFEYDRYGRQFEYFLNFYAVDWLLKSKVKDIIPHLLSIFFLLRCFKAPQLKELLKVYKKTKKITLPRKVRKSAEGNKQKEKNKTEEKEDIEMQMDQSLASSGSVDGMDENKSVSQYTMQESQFCSNSTIFSSQTLSYYYTPNHCQINQSPNYLDNEENKQSEQLYNSELSEVTSHCQSYLNLYSYHPVQEEIDFISLDNQRNYSFKDINDMWMY